MQRDENIGPARRLVYAGVLVLVLVLASPFVPGAFAARSAAGSPQLVGAAKQGGTLHVAVPHTWWRDSRSVTFAWFACDPVDCVLIEFGPQATLVVPSGLDQTRSWSIAVVVTSTAASATRRATLATALRELRQHGVPSGQMRTAA